MADLREMVRNGVKGKTLRNAALLNERICPKHGVSLVRLEGGTTAPDDVSQKEMAVWQCPTDGTQFYLS